MKANYIVARAWVERWETSEPSPREGLSFEAELRHFYIARLVELITKRKEAGECTLHLHYFHSFIRYLILLLLGQPNNHNVFWAQKLAHQEKDKEREQPVRQAKKEMWRVKVEMMKEARKTGKFDSRSGLSSKETKMKEANDASSRPGLMQDLKKRIEEHRIKKEKEAKTKGG
ncbi:hypothetical protein BT96DRAFT_1019190 [Gymnopus androsaceus JB14]|uniref:Uncharacterized protein n=1 Tax=Gymnopus androsaceus JB14 TaxID=1447944 RepID=A0A6A4HPD1_9AGAR|nr:hypothetical protein BT96DRAFT_1019190 [Gymnopus androsaceus JB14]